MLLAHFHDALAAIGFPQYTNLLFGRVSFAFHNLSSFLGPQTNITSGLVFGGSPQDGTREEVYNHEEKVAAKKQFSKKPEMGAAPLMQRTVMIYDTKTGTFGAGTPMLDQSAWPMATIDGNTVFSLGGEGGVHLWHPATFQIGRIEMN